jgi:hypothetical protein
LHTRFRKGQSGNPGGRSKKKLNALLADALNEQVFVTIDGERRKIAEREAPFADSNTGLLGNFELNGSARLFLDYRRSIANSPARAHVVEFESNEVAALKLAVNGRLNIARSRLRPSSWSLTRIVQTSFGFKGRF